MRRRRVSRIGPVFRRARAAGFTLIEALFALAVIGAAVVSLSILLGSGATSAGGAKDRLIALALAQSTLEETLGLPYASIPIGTASQSTIPGHPGFSSRIDVVQESPRLKGIAVVYSYPDGEVRLYACKGDYIPVFGGAGVGAAPEWGAEKGDA